MQLWPLSVACLAILCHPKAAFATVVDDPPTEAFDHSAELIANVYKVYWKSTGEGPDDWITFEVRATTKGWIGLGFSPNGGMPGSDIVVGGVDKNGKGYLWDRYASEFSLPEHDKQQDYELIYSMETETGTVLKFRRLLNTCDKEKDFILGTDTIRLIFAFQSVDADSKDSFPMHEQRGAKSVLLFRPQLANSQRSAALPPNIQTLDLRADKVVITGTTSTVYWCKPFDFSGRFNQKQTLVRYDPIIDPANIEYLHHILVYYCYYNVSKFEEGNCFEPDDNGKMFKGEGSCNQRWLTAWAVGGTDVVYPDDVGVPLFEEGASTVFMMEIHYNNPRRHTFTDSSGMRLYLSSTPRPVESSGVLVGLLVNKQTLIPPRQKSVVVYSVCPADCTQGIPESGIEVFGVFLHAHLLGAAIRVRHFRNGTELKPLAADRHYDFNYQINCEHRKLYFQERRGLEKPVKVLPGDVLVAECTYDSSNRPSVTFGGTSTQEEMCMAFLEYYPRVASFAACVSMPSVDNLANALNATLVYPGSPVTLGKDNKQILLYDYASSEHSWAEQGEKLNSMGLTAAAEDYLTKLSLGTYDTICGGARPDVNHTLKYDDGPFEPLQQLEILERKMMPLKLLPDLTNPPSLIASDPCATRGSTGTTAAIEQPDRSTVAASEQSNGTTTVYSGRATQPTIAPESKPEKKPDSSQSSVHKNGLSANLVALIPLCFSLVMYAFAN